MPHPSYGSTESRHHQARKPDSSVVTNNASGLDNEHEGDAEIPSANTPLSTSSALWGWIVLCFSTGPTSSMINSYVSACIQSTANAVGHVPGSTQACVKRGAISCVVRFGGREIDYNSYLLYLRAIARALEGLVSIMVAGAADYASFRKPMMMASIYVFGALALPFASLVDQSYSNLNALSGLFCALNVLQGVYVVIEASYIPIFMRSVGWVGGKNTTGDQPTPRTTTQDKTTWIKGSRVSVLGLVSSNLGGIVALLVGVVLVHTRGSYVTAGYSSYLLAITISGCITIVVASAGLYLLPAVPGKKKPANENLLLLPLKNWTFLLRSFNKYPQAFKLCIAWVLWHTGYSNFLGLLSSIFLEVAGLTSGSSVYTVYSFTAVVFAVMGSLSWMLLFSKTAGLFLGGPAREASTNQQKVGRIKYWAYGFLSINILCVFWGCLGIGNNVPVGYKHVPEIWIAQFLFMSTSSALRSYNRMLFSAFIPEGSEALYFGLEITLDLATGWINPLVQGVIQDRTRNLRYPMLPNLFLMVISLCLYLWVDVPSGLKDAQQPLSMGS